MAYITNDGSRLIERARTEGKSIVFGSVRMNTTYKSDPTSLVQKSDEWFGENHGSVVGCISHVSVDEVSQVCDSKLAVQCNDNSESWKSIGIYAHLDGEVDELLFACESIENGEYKDVTIVELPVTLDGVVADFGLSEGGSGGEGGGGGEVPANMMTTDTEQTGLTGMKTWSSESYEGQGSLEEPHEGDRRTSWEFYIAQFQSPLGMRYSEFTYNNKEGWHKRADSNLRFEPSVVWYNESSASWSNIINVANKKIPDTHSGIDIVKDVGGNLDIFGTRIQPNSSIQHDGLLFMFDSSGYLKSVCPDTKGVVATIGVVVKDADGNMVENGRVSGFSSDTGIPLAFQSPIQLANAYTITYQAIFST